MAGANERLLVLDEEREKSKAWKFWGALEVAKG